MITFFAIAAPPLCDSTAFSYFVIYTKVHCLRKQPLPLGAVFEKRSQQLLDDLRRISHQLGAEGIKETLLMCRLPLLRFAEVVTE
jgi:hypothetical protein